MSWSLNEVEGLCRKAARGAGLGWGHAEEAGKAARWLCASGWPGAEALAAHLSDCDAADPQNGGWHSRAPQSLTGEWQAASGPLSPLIAGPALCDLAQDWAEGRLLRLGPVAHPLLLAPFMAWASGLTGTPLTLEWSGTRISWTKSQLWLDQDSSGALTCGQASSASIGTAESIAGQPIPRQYRAEISDEATDVLLALAQRTYAPETEASKLAGAGAGLTDND